MKLLVSSHRFAPDIGGIETVGALLCRQFSAAGHEVCVLTESPGSDAPKAPYRVVRSPQSGDLIQWTRWADVVFHNNISLRHAWPLTLIPRPWVAAAHVWVSRPDGTRDYRDRLKLNALSRARVISVSSMIAASLPFASEVVPDPYDTQMFCNSSALRENDIIFVGRLVSDKGADLLMDAIARLYTRGRRVKAKIVGDGPERAALEGLATRCGIASQIEFCGSLPPERVADALRASRIMVVPSRWSEPFGIVALEGLACGCIVVVADGGGLVEAVGDCGLTFKRGDVGELTGLLERVLDGKYSPPRAETVKRHLSRHSPERIASEYLEIFAAAARDQKR